MNIDSLKFIVNKLFTKKSLKTINNTEIDDE